MRNATACKQCRQTKRRCTSRGTNGVACNNCHRLSQQCSFSSPTYRQHSGPSVAARQPLAERINEIWTRLASSQKMALIDNYFTYIHDRPHSLFHRSTFIAELQSGREDVALTLSICALASYLSTDELVRKLGPEMAWASKSLLLENIGTPSVSRIQTAILLANIYAAEREPHAESTFFAIANRMAQILQLNVLDEHADSVTQQVKARVWWTLVMADFWSSAGLMIQRQLSHVHADLPLPGPEDVFQNAHPYQDDIDTSTPGLWAHMIDLVRIFGLIQDLHQELVMERLSHVGINHKVECLARQLDQWTAALPVDKILSERNLKVHVGRGLGGPFVALHLGFHHYYTLLFFHSLDSSQHKTEKEMKFAERCRGHALAFSRLLQLSRSTPGSEVSYSTVGHMTVVSSSVLLHMLLFGNDQQLTEAKSALMGNFAALTELEKSWPSLGLAIRRLFAFQDACQQPIDFSTHRIDQWMFRFLYEHSNSLNERPLSPISAKPSVNYAEHSVTSRFQSLAEGREAELISALDTLRK